MKKFLTVMLIFCMVFCFAACGSSSNNQAAPEGEDSGVVNYDDIPDTCESEDGTYEVAMVTDVGQLKDGSFNQFTWNGCKSYASDNGMTYKYYQPANGSEATDADRIQAMVDACEAGAKVIVTPGFLQETALKEVSPKYPEVQFIFIDGWDLGLANVLGVNYQEEQAGYLAGYATVKEGYTKLGFAGGGGGSNPACIRYGYGFAQGANAAAGEIGTNVEMRYSWEYGASFSASPELQSMLNGWYQAGTEVVFVCGGTMFTSGAAAAEANDAALIGVDVDQSKDSEAVITSACKGLDASVIKALGDFFAGGKVMTGAMTLGAAEDAVNLPVDTWALANYTVEEYEALLADIAAGKIVVDNDSAMSDPSAANLENVTFVS